MTKKKKDVAEGLILLDTNGRRLIPQAEGKNEKAPVLALLICQKDLLLNVMQVVQEFGKFPSKRNTSHTAGSHL